MGCENRTPNMYDRWTIDNDNNQLETETTGILLNNKQLYNKDINSKPIRC